MNPLLNPRQLVHALKLKGYIIFSVKEQQRVWKTKTGLFTVSGLFFFSSRLHICVCFCACCYYVERKARGVLRKVQVVRVKLYA